MAEHKVDYHQRTHGEGIGVYRRESLGDTHQDTLIRRFARDEHQAAQALLKSLRESEPRQRLRAELLFRILRETDLARLEDALEDALKALTAIAPQYDEPVAAPYRSVNPDVRPVPAEAVTALDDHLDTFDEEVA